jgi:flagellar biosynthesis regulator FlaF
MGMREKTKGATVWTILSVAFMMLGLWLVKDSSGVAKTEAANFVLLVSVIVPTFLVVFALPSIYGDSGVAPKTVQLIAEYLCARGFSCAKDVELLKQSVKPLEERARSRVGALKWLVGLLWAGFIYIFSKGFDNASTITQAELMSNMFMSIGLFVGAIAAYLCVWGYEAALDKLFRAIDFGINDFCHLIELSSPSSANPAVSTDAAQ